MRNVYDRGEKKHEKFWSNTCPLRRLKQRVQDDIKIDVSYKMRFL
jgi:hypothetical protein